MRVLRCAVVACLIGLPIGCALTPSGDGEPDIGLPKRAFGEADAADVSPPVAITLFDAGPAADAASEAGRTGPLRAFVSSTLVKGNAIGGLPGADAICNNAAKAAGLSGNFTAWISTASTNAIDRIKVNGPWVLVNGTTLAATKADLAKGTLPTRFDKDEKGATPPDQEDRVWTATRGNGTWNGPDCAAWTGGNSGVVGEVAQRDAQWTNLVAEACGEVNRVYCLEQ